MLHNYFSMQGNCADFFFFFCSLLLCLDSEFYFDFWFDDIVVLYGSIHLFKKVEPIVSLLFLLYVNLVSNVMYLVIFICSE